MANDDLLERVRTLVAKTFGDRAAATDACLRALRGSESTTDKWLRVTRVLSRLPDPGQVLGILEGLAEP